MSGSSHYCPVLGKRVKVKGEFKEAPRSINRHSAMCQNNKKECDGKCEGCSIMVNG